MPIAMETPTSRMGKCVCVCVFLKIDEPPHHSFHPRRAPVLVCAGPPPRGAIKLVLFLCTRRICPKCSGPFLVSLWRNKFPFLARNPVVTECVPRPLLLPLPLVRSGVRFVLGPELRTTLQHSWCGVRHFFSQVCSVLSSRCRRGMWCCWSGCVEAAWNVGRWW